MLYSSVMSKGERSEVLQGTLDLMVLKTLEAMGPQHGYGIARRIEQISDGVLELNEGTVYTALLRLRQRGWITARWGASENNRRARFYAITTAGKKQLLIETNDWERIAGVIQKLLRLQSEGGDVCITN
jgi:PadR family transcriptional regulator PadR